ncbi:tetratricopeptide repeat protein [Piscinibacter sakaiensis]|uniref:tetratricopeptide repeat protein n=1 Tax=Piscinibacter sakaiensis TaxID=1547922 RepID=UPI003AB09F1C
MTGAAATADKTRFKKRISAARMGDREAQYEVGAMLANGIGTERDVVEALVWFKAAAAKGHPTAQYLLAVAFANGVGTDKDEFQAVQWFFKAAEQGNEKAVLKLATRLSENHDAFVFGCFLKAAELGFAEAQHELAERYAGGLGTARNEQAALDWYEKAARQGVARAQFALAERLARSDVQGLPGEDALRWYRAACAQGHPGAQLVLSRLDITGKGRDKAGARRIRKADGDDRRQTDQRWARFAESGHADDRYHVGFIHEMGIDGEPDPTEARRWYALAAQAQHRDAQVALARLCDAGTSSEDRQQAHYWWQRAAEQGSAEAQYKLGRACATGDGADRNPLQSLAWHMRAAEQGHPHALMAVHELLTNGASAAADACLREAAERGQAQAQFMMGQRLAAGAESGRCHQQARDWLERAALQGHAEAQCALGSWHAQGRGPTPDFVGTEGMDDWVAAGHGPAPDFVVAREWFEKAAEQGHARAQWLLGNLYASGADGVARDAKKAMLWCQKAAAAGFAPAQATLGTLFAQAKRTDRAIPWWTKAAVQGDAEAQFNLGNAYRCGSGVEADLRTAFLLMMKAAVAGVAAAQTRVGLAYVTGEGAASDPVEATKWFLIAQRAGDVAAAANCERARSLLSPVQLAEAEWRAAEWQERVGGSVAGAPGETAAQLATAA